MPIAVICPGCRAQFRVNEKFAGKQGPCPKCKTVITIPVVDEIKIDAPEAPTEGAGKSALGAPSAKPVVRQKRQLQAVPAVLVGAATLLVLAAAWLLGPMIRGQVIVLGAGLALLSLPLALAGYEILRDDELEPYRGTALYVRVGICAAVYAALWGGFALLPGSVFENNWNWLFIAPPFLVIGGLVALATLDLSPESAFFHYSFYLLVTLALRWTIGLPHLWNMAAGTAS